MTISSSFNAGVSGLSANATRLAAISDNIANSATYGYKRAETDFHSMVIPGSRGTYSAGGVRATTQRLVDQRGSLVSSTNSTDIAINGAGMFPVTKASSVSVANGENPMLLQTTGSFRPDSQGYLRSEAGLILMGWPADNNGKIPAFPRDSIAGLEPVQINTLQFSGNPTTEMNVAVNLPATSTEAGAAGTTENMSIAYFDNLGKTQNLSVVYTPTVPATGAANEWTMTISDDASGGAVIGEYTLTFDDSRGGGGTLLSVATVSGAAYDPATGSFDVTVASGPINVTIGALGSATGMSQLSDTFAPIQISKNGSQVGTPTLIEIDSNGYVRASYETGATSVLYQIPLIDVPNVEGLEAIDNQTYRISAESGTFFMWDAGDGPTGDIVGYAREESTTDVAQELTDLIKTQRAYSSNAKVFQTVDEMLQETTNIKR